MTPIHSYLKTVAEWQETGDFCRCPRCGGEMLRPLSCNEYSTQVSAIYICQLCAEEERITPRSCLPDEWFCVGALRTTLRSGLASPDCEGRRCSQ